jgi:hypothetical protein
MNSELQEFFSLIGKAKKEKDDEFKSLVGEINIDSIFTQVKESIKEEKIKKEKKTKAIRTSSQSSRILVIFGTNKKRRYITCQG